LQRKQRVTVKLDAVIGRIKGFEIEVSFFPTTAGPRSQGGIDRLATAPPESAKVYGI
jgi:hypothetical protein